MTTTPPSREADAGAVAGGPGDDAPHLRFYEIHSERMVFTEADNADGWIATDLTVAPPE